MKKAEIEAMQSEIIGLKNHIRNQEAVLAACRRVNMSQQATIIKARWLLGRWLSERFDKQHYPVGSTRHFLKRCW